jgi:hypothetical protein
MREWLEAELARELRPTPAPSELWMRVCGADAGSHAAQVRCGPGRALRPIAAIMMLLVAAATLWLAKGATPGRDAQRLANGAAPGAVSTSASCTGTVAFRLASAEAALLAARPARSQSVRETQLDTHQMDSACRHCHVL